MHPSNGRVGGDEYAHSKITSLLASEAEKAKTLRSLAFITFFFLNFKWTEEALQLLRAQMRQWVNKPKRELPFPEPLATARKNTHRCTDDNVGGKSGRKNNNKTAQICNSENGHEEERKSEVTQQRRGEKQWKVVKTERQRLPLIPPCDLAYARINGPAVGCVLRSTTMEFKQCQRRLLYDFFFWHCHAVSGPPGGVSRVKSGLRGRWHRPVVRVLRREVMYCKTTSKPHAKLLSH